MKVTIGGLAAVLIAVSLQASLAAAGDPERVGNYQSDGILEGNLINHGCRGGNVPFRAKIEGGVIEGYVLFGALTSGRPNDYEKSQRKGKAHAFFKFKIRPDGSFGSYDNKDRMFAREHSSGDDKFQWVRGRITGEDHVIVEMQFGAPGHFRSYCAADGVFYRVADDTPAEAARKLISGTMEDYIRNNLIRFKLGANCQRRDGKDAARAVREIGNIIRKYKDKPEIAVFLLRMKAEFHMEIAQVAEEMNCKELMADQFDDALRSLKGTAHEALLNKAREGLARAKAM